MTTSGDVYATYMFCPMEALGIYRRNDHQTAALHVWSKHQTG